MMQEINGGQTLLISQTIIESIESDPVDPEIFTTLNQLALKIHSLSHRKCS